MVLWKTKDDNEGMGAQGRLSGIHEQVDGCLMGAACRRRQNTEIISKYIFSTVTPLLENHPKKIT